MVKKTQKSATAEKNTAPDLSGTVKESAQQIWLAGLGAFAKAQEEGSKVFDTLVKEGLSMQRKTQAAADEKISEATSRMATMATDISSKAIGNGTSWRPSSRTACPRRSTSWACRRPRTSRC